MLTLLVLNQKSYLFIPHNVPADEQSDFFLPEDAQCCFCAFQRLTNLAVALPEVNKSGGGEGGIRET